MAHGLHSQQDINDGIHIIHAWEVANPTERDALLVSSSDIGKVCKMTSPEDGVYFYILRSVAPDEWEPLGSLTSSAGFNPYGIWRHISTGSISYPTVQDALNATSSGETVYISGKMSISGFTVMAGRNVVGSNNSTIVTSQITLQDNSSLKNLKIKMPNSDIAGIKDTGSGAVVENIVFEGYDSSTSQGTCISVEGSSSGISQYSSIKVLSNKIKRFLHLNNANKKALILNSNVTTSESLNVFLEITSGFLGIANTGCFTPTTYGLKMNGGQCTFSAIELANPFYGLHIDDNSCKVIGGNRFHIQQLQSGGKSIYVNPLADQATLSLIADLDFSTFDMPTIMPNRNIVYLDQQMNSKGFRVGEFSSGSIGDGKESFFGQGPFYLKGMKIFTNTNETIGTWADRTTEASSPTSSTFNMFESTSANNCIYVGSDEVLPGLFVNPTGAIDIGTGSLIGEYHNGSSWNEMKIFAVDIGSDGSIEAQGHIPFQNVSNTFIWFENKDDFQKITLNGENKYWIRWRIITAITTSPIVEQMKLIPNSSMYSKNGKSLTFGTAQKDINLLIHHNLTDDFSTYSPSNITIDYSSNISITPIDNYFRNGAIDGNGLALPIPDNLDLSKKVILTFYLFPNTNYSGDIELEVVYTTLTEDHMYNGTASDVLLTKVITIPSNSRYKGFTISFELDLNKSLGHRLTLGYYRDATSSNSDDTLNGHIAIEGMKLEGKSWNG